MGMIAKQEFIFHTPIFFPGRRDSCFIDWIVASAPQNSSGRQAQGDGLKLEHP